MESESATVAVTHSVTAMNAVATSEEAFQFVTNRMTEVVLSDVAVNAMFQNAALMDKVVADTAVMTALGNSNTAMYAIIRSEIAMNKIINSTVAMDTIAANANAMAVIIKAIEDVANGSNAMTTIKSNVSAINSNLPKIIKGDSARDVMTATSNQITTALNVLNSILNTIAVIDKVTRALVNNATAMTAVAASTVAMTKMCASTATTAIVAASSTAMGKIVASTNMMKAVVGNTTAMNIVVGNANARTKFAASTTAVTALSSNTTGLNIAFQNTNMTSTLIASSTSMNILSGSTTAMGRIMAYSASATAFFNGSYYVGKGLNTYGNINNATLAGLATFDNVCTNTAAINAATGNTTVWNKIYPTSAAITKLAASPNAIYVANTTTKAGNILSNSVAYGVILNSVNTMDKIASLSTFCSTAASSSTYMALICGYALVINRLLKNNGSRTALQNSPYINNNYTKLATTCNNTTYFEKTESKSETISPTSNSTCYGYINFDQPTPRNFSSLASLGCELDTSFYRCKVGQTYQFLSKSIKKPDIDPGNVNVLEVVYSGQDKRGHLFTLKAKKPGQATITASLGGQKDMLEVEVEA
ncbi:MAG: hypothetical protein HFJ84_10925 [Clostridiales bacterium]|jgi:hypothetical protein|nr:hypothetical protein [Clostridiales bacterium]